jgi:hypothetical protein
MPVSDTHPLYDKFRPQWQRIQDVIDGEDAVKEAADTYLPKISSKQTPTAYAAYKSRACFFGATRRTREAMTGFIFRKPPTVETSMEALFTEDCDMRGTTLEGYCRKVTTAACGHGRGGTLIDYFTPPEGSDEKPRPYLSFYDALDITNWAVGRIGGRMCLTLLVLREWVTDPAADEFAAASKQRWIVLRLTGAGVTRQEWVSTAAQDPTKPASAKNPPGARESPPVVVHRRGIPLMEIPFVFHNSEAPGPDPQTPPLGDIATLNIHHYNASAELQNARFMCAMPTPWAAGYEADDKLVLGTTQAWVTANVGATCGYLEPSGNGLPSLEKSLEEKERQMAALGARAIEAPKKDAEAEETVRLKASAETSTLARIGLLTSEGLSEIMQWVEWWNGFEAERTVFLNKAYVELNKDFVSAKLTPQELTAYVGAWQQGAMSFDTFFKLMEKGEMYPEGHDMEAELEAIAANPALPPVSGFDAEGNPIQGNPPEIPDEPEPGGPPKAKKKTAPAKKTAKKK